MASPVFKTGLAANIVAGGFDSLPPPPVGKRSWKHFDRALAGSLPAGRNGSTSGGAANRNREPAQSHQGRGKKMSIELNHIVVHVKDRWASAHFLANILGVEVGAEWARFAPVTTANGVTIDFGEAKDFRPQHCAFLVSEPEFDAALARIKASGAKFYAEFDGTGVGQTNGLYGGRGVYFDDPNGHKFELITRPYGPVPQRWVNGAAVKWHD